MNDEKSCLDRPFLPPQWTRPNIEIRATCADTEMAETDLLEAIELERAADWRLRKLDENPADPHGAAAAKLLQKLADEVRLLRSSPVYAEYGAILNWLGEFDVSEEFAERAMAYRAGIGID